MKKRRYPKGKAPRPLRGALRSLGAFRHNASNLEEALNWEFLTNVERAAQPVHVDWKPLNKKNLHRGIHLLFGASDVKRVFSSDCWSERRRDGTLYPTRNYSGTKEPKWWKRHEECFLKKGAKVLAIVIDMRFIKNFKYVTIAESVARHFGVDYIDYYEIRQFLKDRKYR